MSLWGITYPVPCSACPAVIQAHANVVTHVPPPPNAAAGGSSSAWSTVLRPIDASDVRPINASDVGKPMCGKCTRDFLAKNVAFEMDTPALLPNPLPSHPVTEFEVKKHCVITSAAAARDAARRAAEPIVPITCDALWNPPPAVRASRRPRGGKK